jgi:DNA polymerase/3'-5' exonuclease PolX
VDRQIAAGRVEVDVEELSDRLGIGIEKIEQVPGLGPIKPTNIPEDGKKNTPK